MSLPGLCNMFAAAAAANALSDVVLRGKGEGARGLATRHGQIKLCIQLNQAVPPLPGTKAPPRCQRWSAGHRQAAGWQSPIPLLHGSKAACPA